MLKVSALTHVGNVRTNNEDNLLARPITDELHLVLVADGVGGCSHGEVASQTVVDVFNELAEAGKLAPAADPEIREGLLNMAVYRAHHQIAKMAADNPEMQGMSCTLTLALLDGEQLNFAQVGDSRLYLYRDGALMQKTVDQTVARALVEQGSLAESDVHRHPDRNTLSQAMGVEHITQPWEPVLGQLDLQPEDRILLCSDGLTDMVADSDIESGFRSSKDTSGVAQALVDAALEGGGKDNITVIVADNIV